MRLDLVNIKHGTKSVHRFSSGNTLPLTALPHAMTAFAPQTQENRGGWWYHPEDRSFEGIRLTHQPSPWIGDYSWLTFMPQSGKAYVSSDSRWSGFIPEKAELHPHYMSVDLLRYGAKFSLAPTDTGAVIALDYREEVKSPRFAITPDPRYISEVTVDKEKGEIYGYTTTKNETIKREWRMYFILKFDTAITDSLITDETKVAEGAHYYGKGAGVNIGLASYKAQVRLATSYLSIDQARLNMSRDPETYEEAKSAAENAWEEVLSLIDIEADEATLKTFYSCLYRAFLYPTKFYETDEQGKAIHIVAETGEIKEGIMYTNNGFWDTYRTVYPMYSLIAPEKCRDFVLSWINYYDDTGYLPRWPSSTDIQCMPGTLVEAVLADAVVKGLLDRADCERALEAVLKNAQVQSDNPRQGRKCVKEYREMGYVPYDLCHESVNETLDCAYGDFCISQIARYIGKNDIAEEYEKRSKNYRNLFDREYGLMRAKDTKGNFRPDFDPYSWGLDYTEGCSWQSSFAVQQDIEGLAALHGGKDKLLAVVDEACKREYPTYHIGGYGGEIHEMTEMSTVSFNQCAISNQPAFHMPYIYTALGEKDKTSQLIRELLTLFSAADDGMPGDEDNGTMACWYMFSVMGFYPFCPGKAEYVVSGPTAKSIKMKIHGKTTDIVKLLEGKNIITFDELCRGGK